MIPGILSTGESVEVVYFEGETIELVSPRAFAPGAPCAVIAKLDPLLPLSVKCAGSKRIDDGRFRVKGRTIALRREDRERLVHALLPSD